MLDIAIALSLVYLMLSALVSGIHELIASAVALRGRVLVAGLRNLCGEKDGGAQPLTDGLLDHPLLKALQKQDGWLVGLLHRHERRPPSYVPPNKFALALADRLVRTHLGGGAPMQRLPEVLAQLPQGDLRHTLELLVQQAQGDATRLQQLIEAHFDQVMERVSGWYKRRAQWGMLAIGFAVAILLNIDSIGLVHHLAKNSELTASLVARATQLEQQGQRLGDAVPATPPQQQQRLEQVRAQLQTVEQQLDDLQLLRLPVGWKMGTDGKPEMPQHWLLSLFGWMLSAIAASLGGPFWFDAISRLVSLRTTGSKPADTAPTSATVAAALAPPATFVSLQAPATGGGAEALPLNDYESAELNSVDIESLQRALNLPEAEVSGLLDAPTRRAIRRWQLARGQAASGALDEATALAMLYPAID